MLGSRRQRLHLRRSLGTGGLGLLEGRAVGLGVSTHRGDLASKLQYGLFRSDVGVFRGVSSSCNLLEVLHHAVALNNASVRSCLSRLDLFSCLR